MIPVVWKKNKQIHTIDNFQEMHAQRKQSRGKAFMFVVFALEEMIPTLRYISIGLLHHQLITTEQIVITIKVNVSIINFKLYSMQCIWG